MNNELRRFHKAHRRMVSMTLSPGFKGRSVRRGYMEIVRYRERPRRTGMEIGPQGARVVGANIDSHGWHGRKPRKERQIHELHLRKLRPA